MTKDNQCQQKIHCQLGKDCSLDQWNQILNLMNQTPEITLSNTPFDMDDVSWYICNKDAVFIVAISNKKVVGYCYGIKEGTCACLYYIGVEKDLRRNGICNTLLDVFFRQVKLWNVKSIYTLSTNPIMNQVAIKRGFVEGRKVSYFEMPISTLRGNGQHD